MKTLRNRIGTLLIIILSLSHAGCALLKRDVIKPVGRSGYGTVVYWHGFLHKWHNSELHYWDRAGHRTLLWRDLAFESLYDDENDLALFHGWLNLVPLSPNGDQASRFFAVSGPGPIADITDELILRYTKERGQSLAKALKAHGIGRARKESGNYFINVDEIGKEEGTVELKKEDILGLIREAKEKGRLLKDPRYGTPYYKREVLADAG